MVRSNAHDSEKYVSSFNLGDKIQKLKIPVPLVELMKSDTFRKDIYKSLDPKTVTFSSNTINLSDDNPTIVLGPMIEDRD